MTAGFVLPPAGFGPGSQPDEEGLAYLAMPSGMRAYQPRVPQIDAPEAGAPVLALLHALAAACTRVAAGAPPEALPITALGLRERRLLADPLGSGEVSMVLPGIAAQESVFAGVWVLTGGGPDRIEVGAVPASLGQGAFAACVPGLGRAAPLNAGVFNAPPLLTELHDRAAAHRAGDAPHVVNLTLLPHTPEDLDWLGAALGQGAARFLSRGYGNCTVEATALAPVWRVRFYNSTDILILDSFEVTELPEVVLAAPEDLTDSARRLTAMAEAMA